MLGRLKMSEDQCLETFQKYADEVFSHPRWQYRLSFGLIAPKYSDKRLIRATKFVIGDFDSSPVGDRWKRNTFASPNDSCRT
jgi:patatin-like phospholipase/acyl hydrolase